MENRFNQKHIAKVSMESVVCKTFEVPDGAPKYPKNIETLHNKNLPSAKDSLNLKSPCVVGTIEDT